MARGDLVDARYEIEECLSLHPDHPDAKAVRDEIESLIVDNVSVATELSEDYGSTTPNVTRFYVASAALAILSIVLGYAPIMYCLENGFNSTVFIQSRNGHVPYPAHIGLFFSAITLAAAVMVAVQGRCIVIQVRRSQGRKR